MPDLKSIGVFMFASLALNLTPGPDMLYVIARSTSEGRLAGIVSALGIGAGTLVHIAALALGLSALLATAPAAYDVVRLAGAAYLIWLGIRTLRQARRAPVIGPLQSAPLGVVFRQGVVTNVLNPKVALFFLAFLPQFVDPSRGNETVQLVTLGLLFDTSGTLVNVAVATGASSVAARLGSSDDRTARRNVALRLLTGALFIAIGARLLFSR